MKPKSLVAEMIGLLERAGANELEEIDQIIAAREAELETYCVAKRGEIEALRQIRKVCDVKLHGKKKLGRKRKDQVEAAEAPARPPGLADWIASRIEERGPQSTTQLAMAKGASESAIKIAIGKAKGRFLMNDDEEWQINE